MIKRKEKKTPDSITLDVYAEGVVVSQKSFPNDF